MTKIEGITVIFAIWTLNFEKLEICATLIAISRYLEAKFDYSYFMIFFALWFYDSTQFQVISMKNEGVTAIFPNFDFILNYKIVIVKFYLYIVQNCNQSRANFQFFKV